MVVQNAELRAGFARLPAGKVWIVSRSYSKGKTTCERPNPFHRQQTRSWYVQMGKRQSNLGPEQDKALDKYHTLMIGKQGAGDDLAVATLAELFLT